MKTAPNEQSLLDDVLDESSPELDTLGPILRAVRARRRRRQAMPLVTALLIASLAGTWVMSPWRSQSPDDLATSSIAPVLASRPPAPPFERVNTRALAGGERVATGADSAVLARIQTRPEPDLRASDAELFALAGGRGVGLFRFAGRTELLIAGTP